jgi:3-dehydroquinate synthase
MVCASRLAERRGLIHADVTGRQVRLLERFGLPTAPAAWPADELIAAMRHDKKATSGRLRFVLPQRLGAVSVFDGIPEEDVRAVLAESGRARDGA